MYTTPKTNTEIASMRRGGQMLAQVLDMLVAKAKVGMTTKDLDNLAARELKALGGKPAFLGYQGFPNVLCVSINDEVVHGIPHKDVALCNGDIVSVDFGVLYEGLITDAARSVIVGTANPEDRKLVEATQGSLNAAIKTIKDGVKVGDIAAAAQAVLDQHSLGIVRDLVGHGVGHYLHEEPNIPNYGLKNTGPVLKAGMTIAIEPMATLGNHEVYVAADQWTVKTLDHSRAAHFEDTVLITPTGFEVLTRLK